MDREPGAGMENLAPQGTPELGKVVVPKVSSIPWQREQLVGRAWQNRGSRQRKVIKGCGVTTCYYLLTFFRGYSDTTPDSVLRD